MGSFNSVGADNGSIVTSVCLRDHRASPIARSYLLLPSRLPRLQRKCRTGAASAELASRRRQASKVAPADGAASRIKEGFIEVVRQACSVERTWPADEARWFNAARRMPGVEVGCRRAQASTRHR